VNTPDTVYWASAAMMWLATSIAWVWMRHWRLQLQAATAEMNGLLPAARENAQFADWARNMSLTVITVSGAVFSATLPELAASEAPIFRSWNVPVQVTLWSNSADEELTAEVRMAAATQDDTDG
jgi:hypothetical protein